jgi:hypothetical protein
VPRRKLLDELRSLGCGGIMMKMLSVLYSCTQFVLKSAIINFNSGVLQGASCSCLLFTIYLDRMIKMINSKFPEDEYLGKLNVLLLMDDTVILASSKTKLCEKFKVMLNFCDAFGMVVNQKKTKFMVVNSNGEDKLPLDCVYNNLSLTIEYTNVYVYLGSPFTDDGNISTAIRYHAENCQKHLNKLVIFLEHNRDVPFSVKRQVLDACFISSILYSCEAWFGGDLKPLETMYIRAIKSVLGVRLTTCTDLCLVELGYPTFQSMIKKRRFDYVKKKFDQLDMDDPLKIAISLCESARTLPYNLLMEASSLESDPQLADITSLKGQIRDKMESSSKRLFYMSINPMIEISPVYNTAMILPEYHRTAFSRLRLSAHSLKVETGRWSRTERERRTCECDDNCVQDETHVLFHCQLTQHLRDQYQFHSFQELFLDVNLKDASAFIYKVLNVYS